MRQASMFAVVQRGMLAKNLPRLQPSNFISLYLSKASQLVGKSLLLDRMRAGYVRRNALG